MLESFGQVSSSPSTFDPPPASQFFPFPLPMFEPSGHVSLLPSTSSSPSEHSQPLWPVLEQELSGPDLPHHPLLSSSKSSSFPHPLLPSWSARSLPPGPLALSSPLAPS